MGLQILARALKLTHILVGILFYLAGPVFHFSNLEMIKPTSLGFWKLKYYVIELCELKSTTQH